MNVAGHDQGEPARLDDHPAYGLHEDLVGPARGASPQDRKDAHHRQGHMAFRASFALADDAPDVGPDASGQSHARAPDPDRRRHEYTGYVFRSIGNRWPLSVDSSHGTGRSRETRLRRLNLREVSRGGEI